MKKIAYILFMLLASCSWEDGVGPGVVDPVNPAIRAGFITMQVRGEHGSDFELTDDIKTIRFIVFGDVNAEPRAEVNEFHPVTSASRAGALTAVLEVWPTDKLVVAIANEPDTLRTALNGVGTLSELEALELAMGSIVTPDHRSLKPGVMMPMSGAVWTAKADVRATADAAKANPLELGLDRHLARVDVYLTTEITGGADLMPGSTITLRNTFTRAPFVRHKDTRGNEFGRIQTVPDGEFTTRGWSGTSLISEGTDPVYICSFYTPERLCPTNPPTVDIALKTPHGDKNASIELDIDAVNRNNRYIVLGKVRRTIYVGLEVMEWNEGLERFPLGQYFLTVDRSTLRFPSGGGTGRIVIDTNHPDGWRTEEVPGGADVKIVGGAVEVTVPAKAPGTREWSFVVRAGNMGKRINVIQD